MTNLCPENLWVPTCPKGTFQVDLGLHPTLTACWLERFLLAKQHYQYLRLLPYQAW
jgi:hypothetical protein